MHLPFPSYRPSLRIILVVCLLAYARLAAQFGGAPSGSVTPMPPQTLQMYNPNTASINLAFSQALSSNWAVGNENYFAARFSTRVYDVRNIGPVQLRSSVDLAIGANYTNDSVPANSLRVGDNNFFVEGVFVYPLKWALDPYLAGSLRTPIAESFQVYNGIRTNTANLWDPVTSQQSAGFSYTSITKTSMITARTGLALRQTRAEENTLMTDDWTTFNVKERYKPESGIEFDARASFRPDSTITYTGTLGLFGTFHDPDVWSVRWENELRFVLWKSIGLTWTLNVLHDIRQTRRTQFRQAILLGLIQDF